MYIQSDKTDTITYPIDHYFVLHKNLRYLWVFAGNLLGRDIDPPRSSHKEVCKCVNLFKA